MGNVKGFLTKLRGLPEDDEVSTDVENFEKTGTTDNSDLDSDSSGDESLTSFDRKLESQMMAKDNAQKATITPDKDLWVETRPFCVASAFLAIFNLFVTGIEVDNMCKSKNCTNNPQWEMISIVFTLVFVGEIALRIMDGGWRRFVYGERTMNTFNLDWLNCLDSVLIFFRCLDCLFLAPLGAQSGLRYLSLFRIFRIGPAVRFWQMSPVFKELWLCIVAFGETLNILMWLIFMIFAVTMFCAILATMQAMDSKSEEFNFSRSEWSFDDYWGSVPKSAYSLFQVFTKDKWSTSLVAPTLEVLPWSGIIFGTFFCIVGLAFMTSITAVVVETTMASSMRQSDGEQKIRARAEDMITESLRQIFHKADTDGSGEIDMDELLELVKTFKVRARLKLLKIPLGDLLGLHRILDDRFQGAVNVDKYFRGVAKLRGLAKASDLHQLHIDLNTCLERVDDVMGGVNVFNSTLGSAFDALNDMDAKVVIDDHTDDKDPVRSVGKVRPRMTADDLRKPGRQSVSPWMLTPEMMWQEMIETEARDLSKSTEASKEKEDPMAALSEAKRNSIVQRRESRQIKDAEKLRIAKEANQPPPPPLPEHLLKIMDYTDAQKSQAVKAVKQAKAVIRKKVK